MKISDGGNSSRVAGRPEHATRNLLPRMLQNLQHRWDSCQASEGDYFEGDASP